ncbi:class C beta-lactamase [Bordetella petrii]|uniref:class C beta-lactamase n=1 Tax=Bordetella petrii TaxID=94624 RepID=UPI0038B32B4A
MRRRQCMLAALCLCIAGTGVAARPAAAEDAGLAALDAAVRDAARQFMREQDIPGLAVGVSIGGQARLYHYGVASKATRRPVTGDTLFEIGSISKTFTATLAAYAQAAGKLSLRDPIARHLPELAGSRFGDVPLLHLATHTAGGFPLQVPDEVRDTAQLYDYLRAWQPRYPAGSHRTYANPSIGMLGVAAARSLGQPYRAAAAGLFGQLGLSSTYIAVPAAAMERYAQGYNRQDAPVRLNPAVLADEAYGVKTSARDLLRFVELNLGVRTAGPTLDRAIAATHAGYFRHGPMTQDLVWEQYAYPVTLDALLRGNGPDMVFEDKPVVALDPPQPPRQDVLINKTGSTNGFGAYAALVPARRIGIVVLANKGHPIEARVRFAYRVLQAAQRAQPQVLGAPTAGQGAP